MCVCVLTNIKNNASIWLISRENSYEELREEAGEKICLDNNVPELFQNKRGV
jgi:hypothetical protein